MNFKPLFLFSIISVLSLAACGNSSDMGTEKPDVSEPVSSSDSKVTAVKEPDQPQVKTAPKRVDRGQVVFKKCRTCHTLKNGQAHKVGPNLYDFMGTTAGTREGFAYSKAMKASGLVWDDDTLDQYIKSPAKFLPGGRMAFVGLKKPDDRAALIDYLKRQTAPEE